MLILREMEKRDNYYRLRPRKRRISGRQPRSRHTGSRDALDTIAWSIKCTGGRLLSSAQTHQRNGRSVRLLLSHIIKKPCRRQLNNYIRTRVVVDRQKTATERWQLCATNCSVLPVHGPTEALTTVYMSVDQPCI